MVVRFRIALFAGMSFEQWFAALSVGTAGNGIFADGFDGPENR